MRKEEFDNYRKANEYIAVLEKMHDNLILATMPESGDAEFKFKGSVQLIKDSIKREIRNIESYQESL